MNKLIISLFLIGFTAVGYTQNSINGSITDSENNPLFGVDVYAPELHLGTTSDLDGNYELKNLPHGEIHIVFSYFGFNSVEKNFDLHQDLSAIDVVLQESVFNIDEVIVSTPFNRLQSKNVMKVESAKIKDLQQKGAATLIEGISTIAGVSQISTGTSIGKPVIRGLSGNRVLVYTQGVRLENQQFGGEHGLGLNEAGIESVEVIKGPASLLYGSDALGGVLYFNPERFASENTFSGNFGQRFYSNTLGSSTTIGFKNSLEKWKFLVRGAYDSHADYKIPNKDRVTNTRYDEINFNAAVGYSDEKISSELRYNINQSNLGLTEGIGGQTKNRTPEFPFQKVITHILSLHNHIFFDRSKLDVDLGYIYNDRNEFDAILGEFNPALRMKLKTLSYDVKYHLPKTELLSFIVGVQGMHQTNKNLGEELLIPDATIDDLGVLATGILDLKNSSLQAGIRFDTRNLTTEHHEILDGNAIKVFEALDKSYQNFTASLGYKFNIVQDITTRINLATGYRAPNLAELSSNGIHEGTNRYEIGDPNLKSEQNFQTDISIEYKKDHFEVFVNGFYNQLNNYIFILPNGQIKDGADVYEYNQDNAKLYGGEFGFHLHPHPLDWLHLESSFEMVVGKQNNGDYLPLIPANKWSNTLRTEFDIANWWQQGYTSLNVASSFAQNNVSPFETATSSYTLVNLGLGGIVH
ncbi:MAG: TonB-dependent receptor, partial [Flavobacteriaceae bacterium]